MKALQAILLSVASVVLLTAGASFFVVMRHLDAAVQKWGQVDVQAIAKHLDEGVQKGTAAAADVAGIVKEERDAQKNQNREFAKSIANAHDVLVHTDCNLNGCPGTINRPPVVGLLPALAESAGDITDHATSAIDTIADSTATAIDDLDARLRDEHLANFMANMDQASTGLAQTSVHIAGTTADIEAKVHQMTRPVSFAKNVGLTLLDLGSKLGSVFAGFLKF